MNEKIDLGQGHYIRAIESTRNSPGARRILRAEPVPDTKSGNWLDLDCGHRVMAFGNLDHAKGFIVCEQCILSGVGN